MRRPGRKAVFGARSGGSALVGLLLASTIAADDRVVDQIMVKIVEGAVLAEVAAEHQLHVIDEIPQWRIGLLAVEPGGPVDQGVLLLNEDPDVEFAEPHYHMQTPEGIQRTIADLDHTVSRPEYETQLAAGTVGVPAAAQLQSGRGVRVALLDTGISFVHPVVAEAILPEGADFAGGDGTPAAQVNGLDDDGDEMIDESAHHATFVAGLIRLVAPEVGILPVRVLNDDGRGTAFSVVRGILHAIEQRVDLINLSLGLEDGAVLLDEAIREAAAAGIVMVAASGNRGRVGVDHPARHPSVIAVAALDEDRRRAEFSSYGVEIDLSAPGVRLLSAHGDEDYAWWDGTSFAAPLVTGALALLIERYPGLGTEELRERLLVTVQPDANPAEMAGLMGSGLLDADALASSVLSERTTLRVERDAEGARLRWSPVLEATRYDVVRGDVGRLVAGDDAVELGPLICLVDDLSAESTEYGPELGLPLPGEAYFYLFRDDGQADGDGRYGYASFGLPRLAGAEDCSASP